MEGRVPHPKIKIPGRIPYVYAPRKRGPTLYNTYDQQPEEEGAGEGDGQPNPDQADDDDEDIPMGKGRQSLSPSPSTRPSSTLPTPHRGRDQAQTPPHRRRYSGEGFGMHYPGTPDRGRSASRDGFQAPQPPPYAPHRAPSHVHQNISGTHQHSSPTQYDTDTETDNPMPVRPDKPHGFKLQGLTGFARKLTGLPVDPTGTDSGAVKLASQNGSADFEEVLEKAAAFLNTDLDNVTYARLDSIGEWKRYAEELEVYIRKLKRKGRPREGDYEDEVV
ncbi:hypothetical protein DL95DRAFT_458605 [Leptodontidium sp. 2 PMI_412]|nr:hypothetical protein DL95DRAFT_458605 [Leptodontidium sp. 2 PMI_412]